MILTELYSNMSVTCKERDKQCIMLNPNKPTCKYHGICMLLQMEPANVKTEDLQRELMKVTGEIVYTKIDGTVIRG